MSKVSQLLAQYSTQASPSASTYPTIQELLNEIAADLPTTQTDAWRINKINDCLSQAWKYIATTNTTTVTLVAAQMIYGLSTGLRFEAIKRVLVDDSTALTSTCLWTDYTRAGAEDTLSNYSYFKAQNGIGVYPVPTTDDAGKTALITYAPLPPHYSTLTLTTVPNVAPDYIHGVKSFVKAEIAKSGAEPDVDLANNHTADWMSVLSKARHNFYQRQAHDAPQKFDYTKRWNKG